MLGRVASICLFAGVMVCSASAPASVTDLPCSSGKSALSTPRYSPLAQPTGNVQISAKDSDTPAVETPSAPLPPALWPGLITLATLAGVRLTLRAARRSSIR